MRRVPVVALLVGVLIPQVSADPLAEVPKPWADRLLPIPQQRLAELETIHATRIRKTRTRLNALLQIDSSTKMELAGQYGRLGLFYAAHRLYAGAELALHNAGTLDPGGFQWAYYRAHIALEQGEAEQALTALTAAAQIDPDYAALTLRRGQALLALNRLDQARNAYRQALEHTGLRIAALYGLGQIDLLEHNWQAAADRLGEVVAQQPDADAVHYPLSQALIRLGKREEARRHLARRGAIKPTFDDPLVRELRSLLVGARFHFEHGVDAVKRRDYAAAAEAFATGLTEEPANVRARTSYARSLWLSGQPDAARAELERATDDGPDSALPRFLLATIQDADGDHAAADAGYRKVLDLDPDHEGALSYLANLALRQGRNAEAADYFERALATGVTQRPVFLHYWTALVSSGTADTLLRDKLIEFDRRFPEPPVFRYLLARLLTGSEDPAVRDRARALEIARAMNQENPIPPHTELLALTLAANGDFAAAATLQQGLIDMAGMAGAWMQVATLEQTLKTYRSGILPDNHWAAGALDATPPVPDPESAMRNYPAGQPY